MKKNVVIEHVGTPEFEDRWSEATLPYHLNHQPVDNIRNQLELPPYMCKTVAFEYDYVDADYQDEYAAFYCKAFKTYPARCTRLHFFSVLVPKATKFDWSACSLPGAYLGYLVLRPTDLQKVGRTVICPPITDKSGQFVNCLADFNAHLFGYTFSVKGMPFMQQDSQVGVCAQASLWMVARYMSRRYGHRHYFPSEINDIAKTRLSYGRPIPAENGLTMTQIADALEGMGLPAVLYDKQLIADYAKHLDPLYVTDKDRLNAKLADIAYRYIESGLPVIFGTSDHAVVGIGHEYKWDTHAKATIQRIPAFFVNNDNSGCYRRMPLWDIATKPDCSFLEVSSLIAVIPPEVTLSGELAEDMARIGLNEFLVEPLDPPAPTTAEHVLSAMSPDITPWLKERELRTYLMPSVDFQRQLLWECRSKALPRPLCEALLEMDFPKYVWISEVSATPLLNHLICEHRKCIGRVIVDTTAPSRTPGLLAIHIGGLFALYNRNSPDPRPADIDKCDDWQPFTHKVWHNHQS